MKTKKLTRAERAMCERAVLAIKRLEKNKARKDEGGQEKTGFKCTGRECEGEIIREVSFQYLGDPMQMIIGPGSRSQRTQITELYCQECGITYHHLPKSKKK